MSIVFYNENDFDVVDCCSVFVQRQAKYFGVHHFKCPLCNNKDDFQAEMLQFGIYIPDQSVSLVLLRALVTSFNPLTHTVLDRVKLSFVIFDIQAL